MLKRISCDKFNQQPNDFGLGLNIVLGTADGSSAIGKSIFLLLIDLSFGGNLYMDTAKDIARHIGEHQVNFVFEFDGVQHFFYRTTNKDNRNQVFRCMGDYRTIVDKMPVSRFHEWLIMQYGLTHTKLADVLSRATRVYGQKYHTETEPLKRTNEKQETAVESLIKLLGYHAAVEKYKEAFKECDIKPSTTKSRNISDITGDITARKEQIGELEKRQSEYKRQNEAATMQALSIDENVYDDAIEMRARLERHLKLKLQLESRLRAVRRNTPKREGMPQRDFTELMRFFPNADIKALSDIEDFHVKLCGFLEADIKDEIDFLEPQIEQTVAEIARLTDKIKGLDVIHRHSEKILNEYALATNEIRILRDEIADLEKEVVRIKKQHELDKAMALLKQEQTNAIKDAERAINDRMNAINGQITRGTRPAPVVNIDADTKTYVFGTPDDVSEGNTFKNMIVYDLSLAGLAGFPFLVHDSSVLVRLENADLERVLELYKGFAGRSCQVFTALDKIGNLSAKAQKDIDGCTVLRLGQGSELFGKSWARNR